MPRGKRYRESETLFEAEREYRPEEAVSIVREAGTANFDETVELHLRTGADPRHADQQVRGVTILPHGVGKVVRVLVFTEGEAQVAAEEAGADFVGSDDLVKQIQGGWIEFDVSIATPDMMSRVGRLGRILGRRGLMPSPRTGTVVPPDGVAAAVREAKMGRVEYRLDREGLVHVPIGKISFTEDQLVTNLSALVEDIVRARPSGVKGQFIRTAFLTSTMGPSVRMDVASMSAMTVE
jgi:large subunit ribosomal protein L1